MNRVLVLVVLGAVLSMSLAAMPHIVNAAAVHLESGGYYPSNEDPSNLGTITLAGISYYLPADISVPPGVYQAQYAPPLGYTFNEWSASGGVSVKGPNYGGTTYNGSNPTTVTVTGAGTLHAYFTAKSFYTMFSDGFESGSFSAWDGIGISTGEMATVANTLKHHGTYSAKFTSNGGGGYEKAFCWKYGPLSIDPKGLIHNNYARGYFYVSQATLPYENSGFSFMIFRACCQTNNGYAYAGWRRKGGVVKWVLTMRDYTSYIDIFSSTSPSIGRWYCVELHWDSTSAELWVDGKLVCSSYGKDADAYGPLCSLQFGLPQVYNCGSTTVYCDCVKITSMLYIDPEPVVNSFSVSPNPFSPNGDGSKDTTTIKASFNVPVSWRLEAKTSSGVLVQSWQEIGKSLSFAWNGKDWMGNAVADGTYSLALKGSDWAGVQFTPKTSQVVVDTRPPAVTSVSVYPTSFNPRIGQATKTSYTLSESCYVTVKVYNSAGTLIRTLLNNALQSSGYKSVTWNGKTSSGTTVPIGTYTIRIYVVDKAGNKATTYPITKTVKVT